MQAEVLTHLPHAESPSPNRVIPLRVLLSVLSHRLALPARWRRGTSRKSWLGSIWAMALSIKAYGWTSVSGIYARNKT